MIIRFDIYDMSMRETVATALLRLGFTDDERNGWTKPIDAGRRLHAIIASDGLEVHCDMKQGNNHRNVKHPLLRPTYDAIRDAIENLSNLPSSLVKSFPRLGMARDDKEYEKYIQINESKRNFTPQYRLSKSCGFPEDFLPKKCAILPSVESSNRFQNALIFIS